MDGHPRGPRATLPAAPLAALLALGLLAGCDDGGGRVATPGDPATAATPTPRAPGERPHVLLISLDTLRPDHLAIYGYERETAPALSALAAEGTVYDNAYSPASATVASHATMFTGRMPSQHRTFNFRNKLPEDEDTLSDLFGQLGYRTLGVASSLRFHEGSGFDQGFGEFVRHHELDKNDRSDAVTDTVLEWFDDPGETGPLFVFAHYYGPHEPYAPPEPYRSRWHAGLDSPVPEASSRYVQLHAKPGQHVPPATLEYLEALYDGEILFLDQALGRLFDGLAERGALDDLLLVVTSDHGEGFKDNGRMSHSFVLNEELVRIPLILHWPGRIPAGARFEAPIGLEDLLPTLLDLLGAPIPDELAGRSRRGELSGADDTRTQWDLIMGQGSDAFWSITANLPSGRFKLVRNQDGSRELYRIDGHAFGGPDVAGDPRFEREEQMLLHIASTTAALKKSNAREEAVDVDPDLRKALVEMGYAGEVQDADH